MSTNINIRVKTQAARATSALNGLTRGLGSLHKEGNNATKSMTSLQNRLGGINKLMNSFQIHNMGLALSGFGKTASEIRESVHLFEVSLGGMAETSGEAVEALSELSGMDRIKMLDTVGEYNLLSRSMGVSAKNAKVLSENANKLALDLSALTNRDYIKVAEDIRSGLIGQAKTMYKYGVDVTESSIRQEALNQGLTKSVRHMGQAEKMALRYSVMMKQTALSHGDFAQTMNSTANAMRILDDVQLTLTRNVGTALMPMIDRVIPIVTAVTRVVNELVKKLAELAGYTGMYEKIDNQPDVEFGVEVSDGGLDELADDAEDAEDKIKRLRSQLMGFDEINLYRSSDSGISGIDKFLDELNEGTSDFDLKPYNNAMDEMASSSDKAFRMIMEGLEKVKDVARPTTIALTNLWGDGLTKLKDFGKDNLINFYDSFIKPFTVFLLGGEGIARLVNVINDLLSGIDWDVSTEAFEGLFVSMVKPAEFVITAFIDRIEHLMVPLWEWEMEQGVPRFANVLKNVFEKIDWDHINEGLRGFWVALADIKIVKSEALMWLVEEALEPLGVWVGKDLTPVTLELFTEVLKLLKTVIEEFKPLWIDLWDNTLSKFGIDLGDGVVKSIENLTIHIKEFREAIEEDPDAVKESLIDNLEKGSESVKEMAKNLSEVTVEVGKFTAKTGGLLLATGLLGKLLKSGGKLWVVAKGLGLLSGNMRGVGSAAKDADKNVSEFIRAQPDINTIMSLTDKVAKISPPDIEFDPASVNPFEHVVLSDNAPGDLRNLIASTNLGMDDVNFEDLGIGGILDGFEVGVNHIAEEISKIDSIKPKFLSDLEKYYNIVGDIPGISNHIKAEVAILDETRPDLISELEKYYDIVRDVEKIYGDTYEDMFPDLTGTPLEGLESEISYEVGVIKKVVERLPQLIEDMETGKIEIPLPKIESVGTEEHLGKGIMGLREKLGLKLTDEDMEGIEKEVSLIEEVLYKLPKYIKGLEDEDTDLPLPKAPVEKLKELQDSLESEVTSLMVDPEIKVDPSMISNMVDKLKGFMSDERSTPIGLRETLGLKLSDDDLKSIDKEVNLIEEVLDKLPKYIKGLEDGDTNLPLPEVPIEKLKELQNDLDSDVSNLIKDSKVDVGPNMFSKVSDAFKGFIKDESTSEPFINVDNIVEPGLVGKITGIFEPLTTGFGDMFGGLSSSLGKLLSVPGAKIALIVASIALVGYLIYDSWDHVKETFRGIWEVVEPILSSIGELVMFLWEGAIKPLWESLKPVVRGLMDLLGKFFRRFLDAVGWIVKVFGPILKIAIDVLATVLVPTITFLVKVIENVLGVLEGVFDIINGMFELDAEKVIGGFVKIFEGLLGLVKNLVVDIPVLLVELTVGIAMVITELFVDIGKLLFNFVTSIPGYLKNIFTELNNFRKDLWTHIKNFGKRLKDRIVNWFKSFKLSNLIPDFNIGKRLKGLLPDASTFNLPEQQIGLSYGPIPQLADGGLVDAGQLFIANEAGPEMVGKYGSKTGVVNNEQIVQAISEGVYKAVTSASMSGQSGDGGEAVMNIDGRELARVILPHLNREGKRQGYKPILKH